MALTNKLSAIADAIRAKTGGTELLTLDAMPGEIEGIQTGGGDNIADELIMRTVTEVKSNAANIGDYAFYGCLSLVSADLPLAVTIGERAFYGCGSLVSANIPAATTVVDYMFGNCSKLVSANIPAATSIGSGGFNNCSKLASADFPLATSIGTQAFNNCSELTSANIPAATTIGNTAFGGCSNLTSADFPLATSIGGSVFNGCIMLKSADFPAATTIAANAFKGCYSLVSVVLRNDTVCTLSNTSAFSSCYHILGTKSNAFNPEGLKDGYIYVPDNLVDSYKAATNWSTYADQIKPLSEYAG